MPGDSQRDGQQGMKQRKGKEFHIVFHPVSKYNQIELDVTRYVTPKTRH